MMGRRNNLNQEEDIQDETAVEDDENQLAHDTGAGGFRRLSTNNRAA